MKAVVTLILLLMCIAVTANNNGPSDFLKSKWHASYISYIQYYSRRCYIRCSSIEDDLFWNAVGGYAAISMSEPEFMGHMEQEYVSNLTQFIESEHNNATSGITYLDIDQNNIISEEEFYTEHLCLGFGLEFIKQLFDSHKTMDNGIPVGRYIVDLVKFRTDDNEMNAVYDAFKNTSMAYNVDNPV